MPRVSGTAFRYCTEPIRNFLFSLVCMLVA
jgi:hypothetical protein